MANTLNTYEIIWKSGKTERIVAHRAVVDHNHLVGSQTDGHFIFYKDIIGLVYSALGTEVRSVRLVTDAPKPEGLTRSACVDGYQTQVEERWIERAKTLIRCYGDLNIEKRLTEEMGIRPHSTGLPYTIARIARDEIRQEDAKRDAVKHCHHHHGYTHTHY